MSGPAGAQTSATTPEPDSTAARLREMARQLEARDERHKVDISSRDRGGQVHAEVHGLIDHPYGDLRRALADPAQWCAVLLLHINNKSCSATPVPTLQTQTQLITLRVARKYDQPVEQAYELKFSYQVIVASTTLMSVQLDAPRGPLGTSDYPIRLDAGPTPGDRTVMSMSYAFNQGAMTGWAMDLYFATVGRGKVGFTEIDRAPDGSVIHIGGVRGLVERNLMRYFLAMEAAAAEPDIGINGAHDRRLRRWFNGTEAYRRQLHEVDLATFLALKRPLAPQAK